MDCKYAFPKKDQSDGLDDLRKQRMEDAVNLVQIKVQNNNFDTVHNSIDNHSPLGFSDFPKMEQFERIPKTKERKKLNSNKSFIPDFTYSST